MQHTKRIGRLNLAPPRYIWASNSIVSCIPIHREFIAPVCCCNSLIPRLLDPKSIPQAQWRTDRSLQEMFQTRTFHLCTCVANFDHQSLLTLSSVTKRLACHYIHRCFLHSDLTGLPPAIEHPTLLTIAISYLFCWSRFVLLNLYLDCLPSI